MSARRRERHRALLRWRVRVTCEHGGNRVPARFRHLFRGFAWASPVSCAMPTSGSCTSQHDVTKFGYASVGAR